MHTYYVLTHPKTDLIFGGRMMSENVLVQSRQEKYNYLEGVVQTYPERYVRTHELSEAKELEDHIQNVSVAGRITLIRKMGKLSFLQLSDIEGEFQVMIKKDLVGEDQYEILMKGVDLGDFIGTCGEVFTTRTGEKTLRVQAFQFLGKAFRPLPEKFHSLSNVETKYRQRYLDLITSKETRDRFLMKYQFVQYMRRFLEDSGYLEIETPVLIDHPSGATARPFMSHHNALDMDVYLRIAPETYLKRAIIGGFTKVFEVARCFRNEGIDATHLQDFTMVEGYGAYMNYEDNMHFLQEMLRSVIFKLYGDTKINVGGQEIDFAGRWSVVTFRSLILKDCGIDIERYNNAENLLREIMNQGIELECETNIHDLGLGNLIDQLYKKVSRPKMINPTFLTMHPTSLSPLARSSDDNPDVVDRFQLIINGAEVINAYSELVDPKEQRRRLEEQAKLKADGDEEAMVMDDEYLLAMEHGMPPISGWGMGVDRIIQVLTGSDNIKDVVLFPLLRPNTAQ